MTNNRRITQIYPNTANPVRLTYRNDGLPVFQQGDRYGDAFRLSFGQNNYGDEVDRGLAEFIFKMEVTGYFPRINIVRIDSLGCILPSPRIKEIARIYEQMPKVIELINEIYVAAKKQEAFDFSKYKNLWEQFDEDFYIQV